MKWMIASDIHGNAVSCGQMLRCLENEKADRLLLLGDILYHGPRNEVTEGYQPKAVAAMLNGIREKLLWKLEREVPHGTAVVLDRFEQDENGVWQIMATIFVEKASHKAIVIGKGGAMLKEIGRLARVDLERQLGDKVYLELWVKVKEGWRDNLYQMRSFGYENESGT